MAEQEGWDYSSWASSRAAVMDAAKTQLNPSTMGMNRLVHLQMPYGRKPAEHQLTVAQDGTILGATENIMGIPPNSLFMTSAYDTVHAQDLPGLKAVSKYFWERGSPDFTAYLRRRTIDGEWVWLAATLREYIDQPVPGVVINEQEVTDMKTARAISRITRISAILATAVETSWAYQNQREEDERHQQLKRKEKKKKENINYAMSGCLDSSDNVALGSDVSTDGGQAQQPGELQDALDIVRSGVSLDMSKIVLSSDELKMVMVFLIGRLQLDDLAPLISLVMSNPTITLRTALDEYILNKEGESPQKQHRPKDSVASLTSCTTIGSDHSIKDPQMVPGSRSFDSIKSKPTTTSPYPFALSKKNYEMPLAFCRGGGDLSIPSMMQHSTVQFNQRLAPFTEPTLPDSKQHIPPIHRRIQSIYVHREECLNSTLPKLQTSVESKLRLPPPISVLNMAYSNIGNSGIELLAEILNADSPFLKTLDIGFCNIDERGILVLCRGLRRRKKRKLPNLQGLILSGNTVSYRAAKDLGVALSNEEVEKKPNSRSRVQENEGTGYDEDNEYDVEDEDEENDTNDALFGGMIRELKSKNDIEYPHRNTSRRSTKRKNDVFRNYTETPKGYRLEGQKRTTDGLLLLHLACCSLTSDAFSQLLVGLGQNCPLKELRVPSNSLGPAGATLLMQFFEGVGIPKYKRGEPVMPCLDRIDLSNNKIGNDGVAALTKSISRRKKNSFSEIRLSTNEIGALGIETIMNKLYQHNVNSIYLDNNVIGDKGCQLVAASLPSMHSLLKLSLSFNQIGTRGVTSLMRALLGCESLMSLALSGNTMKVSGSIAMGFCLAHHPRLEELELDNCCLSQAAQCHIVAGIISNRWVPMKNLVGFRVAPPMVAIGALEVVAQSLGNEECFRVRRDIQMKAMLERMHHQKVQRAFPSDGFLNNDATTSNVNDNTSFLCLLDWLPRIPFDEDELLDLQNYFLEADGGENSESAVANDMSVVLKQRGDLLANLSTKAAEEIRDINPFEEINLPNDVRIGMSIDSDISINIDDDKPSRWCSSKSSLKKGKQSENSEQDYIGLDIHSTENRDDFIEDKNTISSHENEKDFSSPSNLMLTTSEKLSSTVLAMRSSVSHRTNLSRSNNFSPSEISSNGLDRGHSKSSLKSLDSNAASTSGGSCKTRISMFPQFEAQLQALKQNAQSIMDHEYDPVQQGLIAQEFAETSLMHLRELKYRCMQNGLDGWRVGKVRRKVLIVDDSNVTRKMIARAFEKANFIVDTAENGMEGVEKLKNSIYDIAFMDINMPVMNGFDATKQLREWEDLKRPGVRQPICALTATYVDDFERNELMKFKDAGLDVMESKPCNIPRLFKVVDDVSPMFSDLKMNSSKFGTFAN